VQGPASHSIMIASAVSAQLWFVLINSQPSNAPALGPRNIPVAELSTSYWANAAPHLRLIHGAATVVVHERFAAIGQAVLREQPLADLQHNRHLLSFENATT
jgi:hypothetical protein